MYSLPKRERIHLKKEIDELFAHGKGFVAYPLRVVYRLEAETEAASVEPRLMMLVSVAKRYLKRANKRNRVKRLVREAYRLSKHGLIDWLGAEGKCGRIAFVFVGKELPEYRDIERAISKAYSKIIEREMPPLDTP